MYVSHTAEVHSLPNHTGRIFVWRTNHPRKNFWDLNATGQIAFSFSSVSGVEIAVRSFVTLEVRIRFTFRLRDTKASRKQHRSPPNLKEELWKFGDTDRSKYLNSMQPKHEIISWLFQYFSILGISGWNFHGWVPVTVFRLVQTWLWLQFLSIA